MFLVSELSVAVSDTHGGIFGYIWNNPPLAPPERGISNAPLGMGYPEVSRCKQVCVCYSKYTQKFHASSLMYYPSSFVIEINAPEESL